MITRTYRIFTQSQRIRGIARPIPAEPIQVESALFLDGIAGEPPSELGRVVAVVVVNETEVVVPILIGEPERVGLGVGAGGRREGAERIVLVVGDHGAGAADELADVLVGVVEVIVGDRGLAGMVSHGRQLLAVPDIAADQGIVVEGVELLDELVTVIDEPDLPGDFVVDGHGLLDAPAHVVVSAVDGGNHFVLVGLFGMDQPILGIPLIGPAVAGLSHVAIGVVSGIDSRLVAFLDGGIEVGGAGGVAGSQRVGLALGGGEAIADGVVGEEMAPVVLLDQAGNGASELGTGVVAEAQGLGSGERGAGTAGGDPTAEGVVGVVV
jgi:hypothetical protein